MWIIRGLVAFGIIGFGVTVALVGFNILLGNQRDFADEIQEQRQTEILTECESQNQRNESTQNALRVGSNEDIRNADTEEEREEIRRRRDVTISLIDAVMPVQDCERLVEESVQK